MKLEETNKYTAQVEKILAKPRRSKPMAPESPPQKATIDVILPKIDKMKPQGPPFCRNADLF